MQGSSFNKSLGKRSKMAYSFTTSRIMGIFLLLSTLYCLCAADKEYILNQSNLWDNESSSNEDTTSGWTTGSDDTMYACPQNGQAERPLRQLDLKDAKRVFVEIDYAITMTFGSSGGLTLISSSGTTSDDDARVKHLVNNNKTNRTKTTLFYDRNEDDNLLNLTLYVSKACVKVFKITVYYKVCPTDEMLKVTRTVAPVSGYIEASANCSIKQSGKKGSVVVAKCGSDGKWIKVEDKEGGCSSDCNPGTELISDTCKVCRENYYKEKRGTHACISCPRNTVSESSRTRCKCKKGTYRSTENGPCKTIPSMPKNPNYIRLPFNTIKLHWDISHNEALAHPDLHFRVTCKQYYGISDWGSCRNLSLAARGINVTRPALEIKHLLNNTNYTFSIAALNNVSIHVRPGQWNVATVDVHLAGNPVPIRFNPTVYVPSTERTLPKTTVKPKVQTTVGKSTDVPGTSTIAISSGGEANKNASETKSKSQLAPYIGIAIGAILFIFIVTVIVLYRRKRMKKRTLDTQEGLLMNACPQAYVDPTKYGNPEKAVRRFAKEIDRREIKLEEIIGEGEFAKVHKGMLCRPNEPTVPVALKILKPGSTSKNREDFLTEAAVMGQFKDLNIVALEGVVTISHPVMIITEFMHNGALSNYLVQNKNRFSEAELLGMARGIASGMKYLAKMRFVHRDLAARNVLVNENLVCKVADFGLTRELEDSCQGEYVTQGGKIPIRWTAPEAYKHRRFTTASDVWSFGIVLWEIMTYADRPYGNWDNYMVMEQVTANYRLFAPTNCPKIVHQLMMECWKADRNQRPSFSDIVEMLERWIRNPYLLKDYQYVTEKDRMADRKSCVAKTIRDYLEAIKMDRYIDNFIDFGYTELYQIQDITDDDLVNIGVPLIGHRNKIIKSLRGERELLLPVEV